MPLITIKEKKDKEGLAFLFGQENKFIGRKQMGKWEGEVKEIKSKLQQGEDLEICIS